METLFSLPHLSIKLPKFWTLTTGLEAESVTCNSDVDGKKRNMNLCLKWLKSPISGKYTSAKFSRWPFLCVNAVLELDCQGMKGLGFSWPDSQQVPRVSVTVGVVHGRAAPPETKVGWAGVCRAAGRTEVLRPLQRSFCFIDLAVRYLETQSPLPWEPKEKRFVLG